jgi:dihydrofolate reductase
VLFSAGACRSAAGRFVEVVEEEPMPKLIVNAFLTLDGVMQAPGGPDEDASSGFSHGGWQFPYQDEALGALVAQGIAEADGFLLGRKTYDIFAGYWPRFDDAKNPIGAALNAKPKYVASRTLDRVTWKNSKLLEGDVVAELQKLRKEPGRGVFTWGSTDLAQTLLEHDLVDEFRLFVYPVLLGTGKRLFAGGTAPAALKLEESVTGATGGTYLRYTRAGKPTYGRMGPE